MSLESLTAEEKAQLQRANDAHKLLSELLADPSPEVRKTAMRLAKQKRPDLRFPELEAEEAATAASKVTLDRVSALENELTQERARRLKAEEEGRIRQRGYDPEAVYKLMTDKGVANLDTMLDVLDADAQLAEPSGQFRPFKNPAEEVLKDVKDQRGHVDVDALRSKLIEQAMGEVKGAKQNPLGWLHS